MHIAIGQINTTVGSVRENCRLILQYVAEARAAGASIVVFPELSVTGYPPRDLLNVQGFVRRANEELNALVDQVPEGIVVVVGAPRECSPVLGGRRLVNAAVAFRQGEILLEVPKTLLPTYDVFDESRYFEAAPDGVRRIFEHQGKRIALTLCEDFWNDRLFWGDARMYARDPVAEAVEEGADIIINLSASPFALGKFGLRARMIRHAAARWRRPIVFAAAVGGNDGLVFDGGSLVVREDGQFIDVAPMFESALRIVDLDGPVVHCIEPEPMEELCGALVTGIADYARKTGIRTALVGLSGGIDSALVAALATLALGPSNVLGVSMPSRFSSDHSIEDARQLASNLSMPFQIVPIEPVHAAYESMLQDVLAPATSAADVTFENLQARIRGATLMAISNRSGRLLLTTGNKSECSVGYCTLYGDTCGGLAVIADVWKTQVWRLSRWLNDRKLNHAIPISSITKPPSAELRPDQRDDQSLPPYEFLDPILQELVERESTVEEVASTLSVDVALVREISRKLYLAEYKRKQFAPTIRVTTRAWVGRDFPIAQGWFG